MRGGVGKLLRGQDEQKTILLLFRRARVSTLSFCCHRSAKTERETAHVNPRPSGARPAPHHCSEQQQGHTLAPTLTFGDCDLNPMM